MDKVLIYWLHGYIQYVPLDAGFVTPVFKAGSNKFVQIADENGQITDFQEIPVDRHFMIFSNPLPFSIIRNIGEPAVYGFKFNNIEIYYDERPELSSYIEERIGPWSNNEYLAKTVSSFASIRNVPQKVLRQEIDFTRHAKAIDQSWSTILYRYRSLYEYLNTALLKTINIESTLNIDKPDPIFGVPIGGFLGGLFGFIFGTFASNIYLKRHSERHYQHLITEIKSLDFVIPYYIESEPEDAVRNLVENLHQNAYIFISACSYYNEYRKELNYEHQRAVYDTLQQILVVQNLEVKKFTNNLNELMCGRPLNLLAIDGLEKLESDLHAAKELLQQYEARQIDLNHLIEAAPTLKTRERYLNEQDELSINVDKLNDQIQFIQQRIKELSEKLNTPR